MDNHARSLVNDYDMLIFKKDIKAYGFGQSSGRLGWGDLYLDKLVWIKRKRSLFRDSVHQHHLPVRAGTRLQFQRPCRQLRVPVQRLAKRP